MNATQPNRDRVIEQAAWEMWGAESREEAERWNARGLIVRDADDQPRRVVLTGDDLEAAWSLSRLNPRERAARRGPSFDA